MLLFEPYALLCIGSCVWAYTSLPGIVLEQVAMIAAAVALSYSPYVSCVWGGAVLLPVEC